MSSGHSILQWRYSSHSDGLPPPSGSDTASSLSTRRAANLPPYLAHSSRESFAIEIRGVWDTMHGQHLHSDGFERIQRHAGCASSAEARNFVTSNIRRTFGVSNLSLLGGQSANQLCLFPSRDEVRVGIGVARLASDVRDRRPGLPCDACIARVRSPVCVSTKMEL